MLGAVRLTPSFGYSETSPNATAPATATLPAPHARRGAPHPEFRLLRNIAGRTHLHQRPQLFPPHVSASPKFARPEKYLTKVRYMDHTVDVLRRFNRSYTQRIGVLDDRFLGLDRPLAASRLLWEIGADGRSVADLRHALGVDSAYLSRLLRRLEADGLVTTVKDPSDGRRRRAVLTEAGREEWTELDTRSQTLAERLVAPLDGKYRDRLAGALDTAERLLSAAAITIESVDPLDDAAVEALGRYFDELDHRFQSGFDAGDSITADADHYRSPNGAFLLAVLPRADERHNGPETAACGAIHRLVEDTAEIKRMWVNPQWRGVGLGRRMLAELEDVGRTLGCDRVRLDTNSALTEAIQMYQTAGYTPIDRYNDNPFAKCWFEKQV